METLESLDFGFPSRLVVFPEMKAKVSVQE
jgi:hypothetical protein